jgi:hypothetical protein
MFDNIVNKQQMIHMAAEVVILLGVIIYFNQKNRKLSNQIEDLIQRVEEQEDIIQKHDQLIQTISTFLNNLNSAPVCKPVINASPRKQQGVTFETTPVITSHTNIPAPTISVPTPTPTPAPTISVPTPTPTPMPTISVPVPTPTISVPENQIDLDSEIVDELNELEVLDNEEAQKNAK